MARLRTLLPLTLSLLRTSRAVPTVVSLLLPLAAEPSEDAPGEPPGSPEFWYKLIVAIVLVLAGGVFAGCVLPCLLLTGACLSRGTLQTHPRPHGPR